MLLSRAKNFLYLLLGLALVFWSFQTFLTKTVPTKYQPTQALPTEALQIGGKTLLVEVMNTDVLRMQGLSGREALPKGSGMLFVFDNPDTYGFWMKDMKFAIDIIWLNDAKEVIDIARNVQPNTFPHAFYPPVPVKYVLETNPGEL